MEETPELNRHPTGENKSIFNQICICYEESYYKLPKNRIHFVLIINKNCPKHKHLWREE